MPHRRDFPDLRDHLPRGQRYDPDDSPHGRTRRPDARRKFRPFEAEDDDPDFMLDDRDH